MNTAQTVVESKPPKTAPKVETPGPKLEDYDFKSFTKRPYFGAHDKLGAVQIGRNRICAFQEVLTAFTSDSYAARLLRRNGFYDASGNSVKLPQITKEQLMMLDMDIILSCIFSEFSGTPLDGEPKLYMRVLVYTNDWEDQKWVKFVERCPYARKVLVVPSKMGSYNVTMWLFSAEDHRAI